MSHDSLPLIGIAIFGVYGQNDLTTEKYGATGDKALSQGEMKSTEDSYRRALKG